MNKRQVVVNELVKGSEALASPELCEAKASLPKDNLWLVHSHIKVKDL